MASQIGWRLVLILLVLGGAVILNACDRVSFVERVVLINPTNYDVTVDVRGEGERSWLPLGIMRRSAETAKENVVDVGDTWVFRFSYAGEAAGEGRISRARLESNRWRYQIPEDVGKKLEDRGYPPSTG